MLCFDTARLLCRVVRRGMHRLDLVQHLPARLARFEVVVALHGLLQGEAAVDLREKEEKRLVGER
jgi:hypothetical protein